MPAHRQKTLDDLEPVIDVNLEEAIENNKVLQKNAQGMYNQVSCRGRQLYEKIQEQKELEALSDPLFD